MKEAPSAEQRFALIEIKVLPKTFRVKLVAEEWDLWSHDQRVEWCEEMANEFDKLHFDYTFVEKST